MNRQWLFAACLGVLSAQVAAQTTPSTQGAAAIIEGAGDNSVNTQVTATQGQSSTEATRNMAAPTDAEHAKALGPKMEIQYWQAGAGAADAAKNAGAAQSVPPNPMKLGTPEADRTMQQQSTQ